MLEGSLYLPPTLHPTRTSLALLFYLNYHLFMSSDPPRINNPTTNADTIFSSFRANTFIAQIRLGAIPDCIPSGTVIPANSLNDTAYYTTPEELLLHPKSSILCALGLSNAVCQQALKSPKLSCPRCRSNLIRYRTPSDLLSAILSDFADKTITIIAATPANSPSNGSLTRFAERNGLCSLVTDSELTEKITLDTVTCLSSTLSSLSRIVSPLFRIPDIIFSCEVADHKKNYQAPPRTYTARGWWCNRCTHYYSAPTTDTLLSYTTKGYDLNNHGYAHLGDIYLADNISLNALLATTPNNSATSSTMPQQLGKCYKLMLRVGAGLEDVSLGQPVTTLNGYQLAKLSIVRALLNDSTKDPVNTLLRLPSAIFSKMCEGHLCELLEELKCTNEIFSPLENKPTNPTTVTLKSPTHSAHRIEKLSVALFSPPEERQKLSVVGHSLSILEPLAELLASSLNARALGLKKRDFILFGARNPPYRCHGCNGLGVVITTSAWVGSIPQVTSCAECAGVRCKAPITSVMFRGFTLTDILNAPIKDSSTVLSALPRIKNVLELLCILNLDHLPLGAPCELLTGEELRLLKIATGLAKLKTMGGELTLIIEGVTCGFSEQQLAGLRTALAQFGGEI